MEPNVDDMGQLRGTKLMRPPSSEPLLHTTSCVLHICVTKDILFGQLDT